MTYSYDRRTAALATNALIQFPSGKWGFAGHTDGRLLYETKTGEAPTEAELLEVRRSSNPGMMLKVKGIKTRAWSDPLDACLAAKKIGQPITVSSGLLKGNSEVVDALAKSHVKYDIK